jgi:hypothetical protein
VCFMFLCYFMSYHASVNKLESWSALLGVCCKLHGG